MSLKIKGKIMISATSATTSAKPQQEGGVIYPPSVAGGDTGGTNRKTDPESENKIALPYPPSVNRYWRHVNGRTMVSREGREYQQAVARIVDTQWTHDMLTGRLAMVVAINPPDRRRRDLDNIAKATLDALEKAGVYQDDSQIDLLVIMRGDVVQGGMTRVAMLTGQAVDALANMIEHTQEGKCERID